MADKKEVKFCNQTASNPGEDFAANVVWVNDFKKVNLTPTDGYAQHINKLGLTTFASVDRLSDDSVQRIALAAIEVLAQRAVSRKGDAKKRLEAVAKFAKDRPASIQDENANDIMQRLAANAAKSGIVLNVSQAVHTKG